MADVSINITSQFLPTNLKLRWSFRIWSWATCSFVRDVTNSDWSFSTVSFSLAIWTSSLDLVVCSNSSFDSSSLHLSSFLQTPTINNDKQTSGKHHDLTVSLVDSYSDLRDFPSFPVSSSVPRAVPSSCFSPIRDRLPTKLVLATRADPPKLVGQPIDIS